MSKNHKYRIEPLLKAAALRADQAGQRWTPSRALAYAQLLGAQQPMTAYALRDAMSEAEGRDVKPASAPDTYVVQPGDTLSKLAQRYLGKASRWREIARLNPGHGEKLVPGRSIRLPERT